MTPLAAVAPVMKTRAEIAAQVLLNSTYLTHEADRLHTLAPRRTDEKQIV